MTFKAIFTDNSDEARHALRSFLSAVIGKDVVEVTVTNTEPAAKDMHEKNPRFDMSCTFCDGERAEIEMQTSDRENGFFCNRIVYLGCRLLTYNFQSGADYADMRRVYQVSVCDFRLLDDTSLYHWFLLADRESGLELCDRLNVITLELTKLDDKKPISDLSQVEKWCKFFRDADDETKSAEIEELMREEEGIMSATKVLSRVSADERAWKEQLARDIVASDWATAIGAAERRGRAESAAQLAEMAAEIERLKAEVARLSRLS